METNRKTWSRPDLILIDTSSIQHKSQHAVREGTGHYSSGTGPNFKNFMNKIGTAGITITFNGVPVHAKSDAVS
ncbi:hypothetical protein ACFGVR_11835 [Mucilaginibacter sp. AW1-3]